MTATATAATALPFDLHRAESHTTLAQLPEPKRVFHHLLMCMETPRPSGALDAIRAKLRAFADHHALEYAQDAIGNVCIRRKAAPGFEHAPSVVVQGHLDMVCSQTNDKEHDFHRDPITPVLDGAYLKADRTTLGADNGIGVAAAMALLEDASLKTGQIEALFTVDEETTMAGAEHLAGPPFLQSKIMINADSESENGICVGCAGGFEKQIRLAVRRVAVDAAGGGSASAPYTAFKLHMFGLLGGHTGVDIHLGRANSLICMARLLDYIISDDVPMHIASLRGGNAPNAIPRDATVVVYVETERAAAFEASAKLWFGRIRDEFAGLERTEGAGNAVMQMNVMRPAALQAAHRAWVTDSDSTRRIIDLMMNVPHGPLRMVIRLKDAVDTSTSFSLGRLDAVTEEPKDDGSDHLLLQSFSRSSSDHQMDAVERRLNALCRSVGAKVSERLNYFPGWTPNLKSPSLTVLVDTHKSLFPNIDPPRVYSVHAGLECGLFQRVYPFMDCVSIGPVIEDAHSPDERLRVDSVLPFYLWLRESVIRIQAGSSKSA